jgi:hypothetical protein
MQHEACKRVGFVCQLRPLVKSSAIPTTVPCHNDTESTCRKQRTQPLSHSQGHILLQRLFPYPRAIVNASMSGIDHDRATVETHYLSAGTLCCGHR